MWWDYLQWILPRTLIPSIIALAVIATIKEKSGSGIFTALAMFGVWGAVFLFVRWVIAAIESNRPDLLAHNPRLSTAVYVIALSCLNLVVVGAALSAFFDKPGPERSSSNSMEDKRGIYDRDGRLVGYIDSE